MATLIVTKALTRLSKSTKIWKYEDGRTAEEMRKGKF